MEDSLFEWACRCAVSLKGRVEHQGAIKRCFVWQLSKNFIENTRFSPSDKPIVQHFVRVVLIGCILLLKSIFNAPVINAGDTVRVRKDGFDTF